MIQRCLLMIHCSETIMVAKKKTLRNGKQINPGIYSCGHQGSEIFMNFINPHYPGHDNVAGTCHFRILPNAPEICQVSKATIFTS